MKTIGLLGGIGWASTAEYYRILNELTVARMGDAHSARIAMISMDQFDFTSRAAQDTPEAIHQFLIQQAARLQACGAEPFLLCANGAHRFVPAVLPSIGVPFISIVNETSKRVQGAGIHTVGLLGVKQTMAGTFYHESLAAHGVEVLTPGHDDQELLHDIIYAELVQNRVTPESKKIILRIINDLVQRGASGIILGCTEIPLIITQDDVTVPVFNTTRIHCEAAIAFSFDD